MLDSRAVDRLIARSAAVLLQKPFKERGSVISALHRHTEFLDSLHLYRTLGQSTFDLADLKRRHTSVFLCLPSDRLPEYHRWMCPKDDQVPPRGTKRHSSTCTRSIVCLPDPKISSRILVNALHTMTG